MNESRESILEAYLVREVKKLGGAPYKFSSPQRSGVPDRLICWSDGRAVFVEVKAKGRKPTALQNKEQERLRARGFLVFTLDSQIAIDNFIHIMAAEFTIGTQPCKITKN